MSNNDTVTETPPHDQGETGDDLRLVLDALRFTNLVVGHVRVEPERARDVVSTLFGEEPSSSAVVLVVSRSRDEEVYVSLDFDLRRITDDVKQQVAQGIGRDRRLVDLLGGLPIEVTDRLDAAKSSPRLASHLIATAADHLVWKIRLLIQDTLAPVNDDGETLSWCGDIPLKDRGRLRQIGPILPFATVIRLDIPATLESANV
jgi:hypothetical protein